MSKGLKIMSQSDQSRQVSFCTVVCQNVFGTDCVCLLNFYYLTCGEYMCWHTMKKESSIHIETGRTSIDSWIAKEKIVMHLVRKCSKFDF